MTHQHTINRDEAIELFDQLMGAEEGCLVLRLLGESKMGKSHLVTKVFPELAQEDYGAAYAILDLRGGEVTVLDILHRAVDQLGGAGKFPRYYEAYEQWLERPKVEVRGLQALLSSIKISQEEREDEGRRRGRHLTSRFTEDLENLGDRPILLLFDAMEKSGTAIQTWLMDELLVSLARLEHVRTVVAGQSMPEAAGRYARACKSYELRAVEDERAYISYCRQLKLNIEEQVIINFALVFDYKPGLFVDWVVPKYAEGGGSRG